MSETPWRDPCTYFGHNFAIVAFEAGEDGRIEVRRCSICGIEERTEYSTSTGYVRWDVDFRRVRT